MAVIVATFLTSLSFLLLNFLPEKYLVRFQLKTLFANYSGIFIILFFASMFLLIVHLIIFLYKRIEKRAKINEIKKIQITLLKDFRAQKYLLQLYENNPEPTFLPINNQKVKLLSQYGLITQASKSIVIPFYEINDPEFPFLLQPITEKYIQEHYAEICNNIMKNKQALNNREWFNDIWKNFNVCNSWQ